MKVFYICDGKCKCSWSTICRKKDGCNHTSDPEHALMGVSDDSEHDKRFSPTPLGDLWEVTAEIKFID